MATKYAGQNSLNKLMSLIKNAMPKASTGTPLMDGTAAVGTSNAFARGDHVHPSDTAKVSKAGDTMTGTLTVEERVAGESFRIKKDDLQVDCMAINGADATYLLLGETSGVDSIPVRIHGVAAPNSVEDAANKAYVDGKVSGLQNAEQVQAAISAQLGSVYKPMGSCAFDGLPPKAQAQPGWVFNITDAFTTTDAFAEGPGHAYPAGTNIVWIKDQNGVEMWDVLAGTIDLTELTADEVQSIWDSI